MRADILGGLITSIAWSHDTDGMLGTHRVRPAISISGGVENVVEGH